jgi:arginine utilization protein RocB
MKKIIPTISSIADAKAHVINHIKIEEVLWNEMLFDYGLDFAKHFANNYQNPQQMFAKLTQTKAKEGYKNNSFWSWWMFNWLLDDREFCVLTNTLKTMTYQAYKSYMVNNEELTKQLMQQVNDKNF